MLVQKTKYPSTAAPAGVTVEFRTQLSSSGSAYVFRRCGVRALEGCFSVHSSAGVSGPLELKELRLQQGSRVLARITPSQRQPEGTYPAIWRGGPGEPGYNFSVEASGTEVKGDERGVTMIGVFELADRTRLELRVPNKIRITDQAT